MHREVVEETALSTYYQEFLCVQEFVFDKVFYKKRRFISPDVICKTKDERVVFNNEAQEYLWAEWADCADLPIEPHMRKMSEIYQDKYQ